MTKQLNIGMVGYGFMARAHSHAWANVSHFFDTGYRPVLKAVAARNVSKLRHFAEQWGYESQESDWRSMIARRDIDAIDICVPNDLHAEMAIAAAKAKLDSAEKAGVGGNAGDVLNRSRTMLEQANAKFRDDEDRFALALARQAEALADLATATAEARALEAERSKIASN